MRAARALCGRGVRCRRVVRGVRLTLRPRRRRRRVPGRPGEVPARPVILFVPGNVHLGFEAADLLPPPLGARDAPPSRTSRTATAAGAVPARPAAGAHRLPRAARWLHAAQLGFRAEPLVLAGLSASNLAVSAILAPLLPQHCREEALELRRRRAAC